MWVSSFEVVGFLGRDDVVSVKFNRDLNIITGRNGAGKTSLLKLMWYIMSGNILIGLREVSFSRATLITSEYECTVHRVKNLTCKVDLTIGNQRFIFEDVSDDASGFDQYAEDQANEHLMKLGASVFLPTFRRIEGGFTLTASTPGYTPAPSGGLLSRQQREKNDVEEGLAALARKLTNGSHTFVSSISTIDIVSLLMRKYTDLSEEYNNSQRIMSQRIIETIKHHKTDGKDLTALETANKLLDSIRTQIEDVESSREKIMTPIGSIRDVVTSLFKHSGIKFNSRLSFGDAAVAVNSEWLSAGEKQMLSFISYNGFYDQSVVLIDEPELSLHVDWQRQLLPILIGQKASNQFIVATHSPFIYSKYPEKEICIVPDRGDSGE